MTAPTVHDKIENRIYLKRFAAMDAEINLLKQENIKLKKELKMVKSKSGQGLTALKVV